MQNTCRGWRRCPFLSFVLCYNWTEFVKGVGWHNTKSTLITNALEL